MSDAAERPLERAPAETMDTLEALLEQLTAGDDERSEAVATSLWSFGTRAVTPLSQLLRSPEPDVRWWAVRSLAQIPDPQVSAPLREGLRDPELTVRQCAALALREHPDAESIAPLCAAILAGDRMLAHLAGDALAAIGGPAVPALLDLLESGPQIARLEAVRALSAISDKRAIPALFAALDDDSAVMQHWAEIGLARMGVGMLFYR